MNPEIAVVVENGSVIGIATAGQSMTVRVIDLDNWRCADYEPDAENIDMEKYTKEIMEIE